MTRKSLLWLTFSSIPTHAQAYLGCSAGTLDLFLDEGPILFCVAVFPATLLLLRHPATGLRRSVVWASLLCFAASLLRALPAIMTNSSRAEHAELILALTHIAQIINAAVAPLVVASPSFLSLTWFPETERNTATAIANSASALGRAIGFFLGPALVTSADDVSVLLGVTLALAAIPVVCVLAYYPAAPLQAPSDAALKALQYGRQGIVQATKNPGRKLLADMFGLLRRPAFTLLVVAGGLQMVST